MALCLVLGNPPGDREGTGVQETSGERATEGMKERRRPARRASAAQALELATATHLAGRRVDMGTLARELGVARATLYRWFGTREALMEEVLLRRARAYVELARQQSSARGDERLVQIFDAMLDASRTALPVRLFIEREPALALRILAGERGRLHRFFVEEALRDLAEVRGEEQAHALETRVEATVQLITTLVWVAIAIGDEPPAERIELLIGELLTEHTPTQGRRRPGPSRVGGPRAASTRTGTGRRRA
jgi:AcrR family transcriptional regulator